jgi:hypothetical protein
MERRSNRLVLKRVAKGLSTKVPPFRPDKGCEGNERRYRPRYNGCEGIDRRYGSHNDRPTLDSGKKLMPLRQQPVHVGTRWKEISNSASTRPNRPQTIVSRVQLAETKAGT